MYLRKAVIKNIRSIEAFSLDFPKGKEAGWHVLIGENGSGKTSILRAIAACLIGPRDILRINPDWSEWMRQGTEQSEIKLTVSRSEVDYRSGKGGNRGGVNKNQPIVSSLKFHKNEEGDITVSNSSESGKYSPFRNLWGDGYGWFSCSFGALRRFIGGDQTLHQHFIRNPRIGAHLSLLKSEVALTESLVWIKDVFTRAKAMNQDEAKLILDGVNHFINKANLLPEGYFLKKIDADGVFFETPGNSQIHLYELSEGIRSVMSLAIELIRLLIQTYGVEYPLNNIKDDNLDNDFIPCVGIVLIDEIDAHLHPTWQVRIGQWFTTYFPNIQFIVTTHSPLICRAAEKGSVWRLAAPGSKEESGLVAGPALKRLIYGNVLDAYGTEVFGENVTSSDKSTEMRERLAYLNQKSIMGDDMTSSEIQELEELKTILPLGK